MAGANKAINELADLLQKMTISDTEEEGEDDAIAENGPQRRLVRFSIEEAWHLIRAYMLVGKDWSKVLDIVLTKLDQFPDENRTFYQTHVSDRTKLKKRLSGKFRRHEMQIHNFSSTLLEKIKHAEMNRVNSSQPYNRETTESTSPTCIESLPFSQEEILQLLEAYQLKGPDWPRILAHVMSRIPNSDGELYERSTRMDLQRRLQDKFCNLISDYTDDDIRMQLQLIKGGSITVDTQIWMEENRDAVPTRSNVDNAHVPSSTGVPLIQPVLNVPTRSNVDIGHVPSSTGVPLIQPVLNRNSLYNGRLSEEQQDQLASFIGKGPKDFHLLYSAQRDTCSPDAFHRHCDYEGPTVTVLYNPRGTVYGGYTSMSWFQAEGVYVLDPSAFLFQLKKNGNSSFKKFPCTDPINAISCDTNKAAVFGNGPDLHLMNGPITRTDLGFFPLDGEINFGSYNMQGVDEAGFCDDTLEVTEIEVYRITGNYSYNGRLSGDQREKLVSFIGKGPKDFELLYSARLNTYSPDAFHRHCDYKGPTVTVLYNPYDTVYGGYTSMSWIQAGGVYVSDPSAFLFQLEKNGKSSFKKFPCIDPMNAIFCDTNKAAVFGNGPDLHLMNGPITQTDLGIFPLDGEINFGSYNMQGVDKAGFCDDTLKVTEIEVYSITENTARRKWDYFSDKEMRLLLQALRSCGPNWNLVLDYVQKRSYRLPNADYYRYTEKKKLKDRLYNKVYREMPGIKGENIRKEAIRRLELMDTLTVATAIAGAEEDPTNSESGTSRHE